MLRQRILTGVVLGPLVLWVIAQGGWPYYVVVLLVSGIATVEWVQLAKRGGNQASSILALMWALLSIAIRIFPEADVLAAGMALTLVANIGWAIIKFRGGDSQSMVGFSFTASGGVYLGWVGSHLIALRDLSEGGWWMGLTLGAVWIADIAAYFVGKLLGRRKLMPAVSPGKTWEGYVAGIVISALGTAGLAELWQVLGASTALKPVHGLALGLIAGAIGPLGDLGISTFKRQVGAKNSGNLLPGHGGLLDRVDALMVASPLCYYYVIEIAL